MRTVLLCMALGAACLGCRQDEEADPEQQVEARIAELRKETAALQQANASLANDLKEAANEHERLEQEWQRKQESP